MKRTPRRPERPDGDSVHFDVSTEAHPDTWATVDAADWPALREIRWSATKRANGLYVRNAKLGLLHRFLRQPLDGQVIDHVDGNPLNNRRDNLRVCSQGENNTHGAARRRGYEIVLETVVTATKDHVVKVPLADGTMKEYRYPTRAKSGTKTRIVRKMGRKLQNGVPTIGSADAASD